MNLKPTLTLIAGAITSRPRLIFCAALLPLGAALAWFWISSEPRYEGIVVSRYVLGVLNTNRFSVSVVQTRLKPMGPALAVPALEKVAAHDDLWWRRSYLRNYSRLPVWLQRFVGPPKSNRQMVMNAAFALGEFGYDARPAVPVLLRLCEGPDTSIGANALQALKRIGPAPTEAVPALARVALSTNSSHTSELAIDLLKALDPAGKFSAHTLHRIAVGPRIELRVPALKALASMAWRSPALLTNHWAALRDSLAHVRTSAARTLNEFNVLTWESLEPSVADLSSANRYARHRAAELLGIVTKFGDRAAPLLGRAVDDADGDVRNVALLSLYHLVHESNAKERWRFDAAVEVLNNGSPGMRWDVIGTFDSLAPDFTDEMVPPLVSALRSTENRLRGRAAQQLGRLGEAARSALPELKKLLGDDWSNVRDAAAASIKAIEAEAR